MNRNFWTNKKVFVTGHTGFKGSWLCLWLHQLGAQITGYSLPPNTTPNMYTLCRIDELLHRSILGDIRNLNQLHTAITESDPDIIIHMAAQPLVRESYHAPLATYEINVLGTLHVLESLRCLKNGVKQRVLVNVTTDKCYANNEWVWGYRENDPLGGHDPYSSSKACSELATAAYRSSYFPLEHYKNHLVSIASARAGNVIGGGDWAADRLIPDCIRSLLRGDSILVRNPHAIRPWQHVLEPLSGYLMLAEKMYSDGAAYAQSWNFGPHYTDAKSVAWIVQHLCDAWKGSASYTIDQHAHPHEAHLLKLDCSKAITQLGWTPRWDIDTALHQVIAWVEAYRDGQDLREVSLGQILQYTSRLTSNA